MSISIVHGHEGGPPPENSSPVLEAAARALADLSQPDLRTFPDAQVWAAIASLIDGADAARNLDLFRARIRELSNGMTRLEDADKTDFAFESKEWGVRYQRLVGLFTDRMVIIGRSRPEFLFVPRQ